jgi:hypothetical protein
VSTTAVAPGARQGPCRVPRPKHASERRTLCRTHDRTSSQVRPTNYDTRVEWSRFLEVDPVEGGSANDYDYVEGDPVNQFDLDGTRCWTGENKNGSCRSLSRGAGRGARFVGRRIGAQVNGCVGYVVAYCVSAGVSFRDGFYFNRGGGHGFGWSGPSIGPTWQSGRSRNRGDCHSGGFLIASGSACYGGHRVYNASIGAGTGGYFHTRYRSSAWKPWR